MSIAPILSEYGIQTIPTNVVRGPMQTHAGRTLERLAISHGEGHLRDVLTCLVEGENNGMALVAPVITAVSEELRVHREWWERDASAWLTVMDRTDLTRLHRIAKGNQRAVSAADAIATLLYRELAAVFDPPKQPDFFDPRESGNGCRP